MNFIKKWFTQKHPNPDAKKFDLPVPASSKRDPNEPISKIYPYPFPPTTPDEIIRRAKDMVSRFEDPYAQSHAVRYAYSMAWLEYLHPQKPLRVLELGGGGAFNVFYREQFPQDEVVISNHDLRYLDEHHGEYLNGKSLNEAGFDIILCMEVFEHINDQNTKPGEIVAEWAGSGTRSILQGMYKLLRPGGWLLLTTPNSHCATNILHILRGAPAVLYRPHVREYGVYELDALVKQNGFKIVKRETTDAWRNVFSPRQHFKIMNFLKANKYPTENRGEDIMMLAQKPTE